MSSRSSTSSSSSSSRRSWALGAVLVGLAWLAAEAAGRPRTAFYGGRKLAEKIARLEELERSGPVEVFVIGASYVDQGFDARSFGEAAGVRAFNLGVQGTDMYFQSILLRDVLLIDRAPRAILWGLRDDVLTRSNINRQYLDAVALDYASGPLGPWAYRLGRHLPQFQRRRVMDWLREVSPEVRRVSWESSRGEQRAELRPWLEPVDAFGRTELSTLTRHERRAPREREDRGEERDEVDGEGTRFMDQDFAVPLAEAQAHVEETLRLLRARGTAVWFFFTPYSTAYLTRGSGYADQLLGASQGYHDWLSRLAAELDAPIVDLRYCRGISDEPSFYFDLRHLNAQGAAPLGKLLGEIYSGARPLPEEWSGAPSRAQVEFIRGSSVGAAERKE